MGSDRLLHTNPTNLDPPLCTGFILLHARDSHETKKPKQHSGTCIGED